MQVIKVAAILFLGTWIWNLHEQSSARSTTFEFKDEGDGLKYRQYRPEDRNTLWQWERYIDTFDRYTEYFAVEDFSPFVSERAFDSILDYYNSSNFEALPFKNSNELAAPTRTSRDNYYTLFRKIYGAVQHKTVTKREMLIFKDKTKHAIITYTGSFKTMAGQFSVRIDVSNKETPYFIDMFCTPFDYTNIAFFRNISALTIEYIKQRNIMAMKEESSRDVKLRMMNKAKLQQSLEGVNCDSLQLFTSNLVLQGDLTYARVVYNILNSDDYLALIYVSEDNKFKLYNLGFIPKATK